MTSDILYREFSRTYLSGIVSAVWSGTTADLSGATIDVISGIIGSFNSGVTVQVISGNTADFSGATINIVSGLLGAYGSGVIGLVFSGNTVDLSGATIDVVSGLLGAYGSGVMGTTFSGNTADFSGATIDVLSGISAGFAGRGSGYTAITIVSGDMALANRAFAVSLSGVQQRFIEFAFAESDTSYMAWVILNQSGFYAFVSGKTVSGFSVGLNTTGLATPTTFDWAVIR